jgi:hypothetical protein
LGAVLKRATSSGVSTSPQMHRAGVAAGVQLQHNMHQQHVAMQYIKCSMPWTPPAAINSNTSAQSLRRFSTLCQYAATRCSLSN